MYLRPQTIDEACAALAETPAAILSGGTDFYPALGERPAPTCILDLSRLAPLARIETRPDRVRIGARTTWTQIVGTELPPCFDTLKAAAREIGSVQIQNVATLAGNLCNASPAADGVPPLLALDAAVELRSRAGTREMPLVDFLIGNRATALRPDEIMTAILVPLTIPDGRSVFLKLGARRYLVISIAMVAAVLSVGPDGRVAEARVAVGSCSAVARRLHHLEAALIGASAVPGIGHLVEPRHFDELAPIDDLRATAAYRDSAAIELVRRALDACLAA